jgi:hypothetical protein
VIYLRPGLINTNSGSHGRPSFENASNLKYLRKQKRFARWHREHGCGYFSSCSTSFVNVKITLSPLLFFLSRCSYHYLQGDEIGSQRLCRISCQCSLKKGRQDIFLLSRKSGQNRLEFFLSQWTPLRIFLINRKAQPWLTSRLTNWVTIVAGTGQFGKSKSVVKNWYK